MKLITLVCFIMSLNVFGQDSLDDIKISKEEIATSLEKMRQEGQVSEADYLRTKKELGLMNQTQIDSLNKKAIGIVKKNPAKAEDASKNMQKDHMDSFHKELDKLSK